jgi:hypothetical protein
VPALPSWLRPGDLPSVLNVEPRNGWPRAAGFLLPSPYRLCRRGLRPMLLPYAIVQTAFPFLAGLLAGPSLLPVLADQVAASVLLPSLPPELEEGQRMIIEEVLRVAGLTPLARIVIQGARS